MQRTSARAAARRADPPPPGPPRRGSGPPARAACAAAGPATPSLHGALSVIPALVRDLLPAAAPDRRTLARSHRMQGTMSRHAIPCAGAHGARRERGRARRVRQRRAGLDAAGGQQLGAQEAAAGQPAASDRPGRGGKLVHQPAGQQHRPARGPARDPVHLPGGELQRGERLLHSRRLRLREPGADRAAPANMSELAGVLAHEIGHVVERHGIEQMAAAQNANTQLGLGQLVAAVLLGRQAAQATGAVGQVGGHRGASPALQPRRRARGGPRRGALPGRQPASTRAGW